MIPISINLTRKGAVPSQTRIWIAHSLKKLKESARLAKVFVERAVMKRIAFGPIERTMQTKGRVPLLCVVA